MHCLPARPSSVFQDLCQFLRRTALLQSPAVKAAGPLEAPEEFRQLNSRLRMPMQDQVKNFKSGRGWETGDAQEPFDALDSLSSTSFRLASGAHRLHPSPESSESRARFAGSLLFSSCFSFRHLPAVLDSGRNSRCCGASSQR